MLCFCNGNNIHFFSRHNSHFTGAFKPKLFSPVYYSVPSRTFHLVAQMREQLPCRINCEFFAGRHICVMFPVYVNISNKSYPLMNSFLSVGCLPSGIEETEFCALKPNIGQWNCISEKNAAHVFESWRTKVLQCVINKLNVRRKREIINCNKYREVNDNYFR